MLKSKFGKYYCTFDEYDHLEEVIDSLQPDLIQLDEPITVDSLTRLMEKEDHYFIIPFLIYLFHQLESNEFLEPYSKQKKHVNKILNDYLELIDDEEYEKLKQNNEFTVVAESVILCGK